MRTALVLLLLLALVLVVLWFGQRRLIYLPDTSAVPPAATVLPAGRDVVLTTGDGLSLGAWLVPPTPFRDLRMAVLLAPGNGGNRLGRAPLAAALAAEGFTVLLMDYRGYGGNPGHPSQPGLALDVRAARARLVAVEGWAGDRIIYLGESLGSAVVAELAIEHPPAGLVLRSPFVDLAAAGAHNYPLLPVRLLLRDRLPVAELVARVRVPTVIVYGTADSIVPPEQSREVAVRAAGPVVVVAVEGADHNDPALVGGADQRGTVGGADQRGTVGGALVGAVVALAERIERQT